MNKNKPSRKSRSARKAGQKLPPSYFDSPWWMDPDEYRSTLSRALLVSAFILVPMLMLRIPLPVGIALMFVQLGAVIILKRQTSSGPLILAAALFSIHYPVWLTLLFSAVWYLLKQLGLEETQALLIALAAPAGMLLTTVLRAAFLVKNKRLPRTVFLDEKRNTLSLARQELPPLVNKIFIGLIIVLILSMGFGLHVLLAHLIGLVGIPFFSIYLSRLTAACVMGFSLQKKSGKKVMLTAYPNQGGPC